MQCKEGQGETAPRYTLRLKPGAKDDLTYTLQAEHANLVVKLKEVLAGLGRLGNHLESWQVIDEMWAGRARELFLQQASGAALLEELGCISHGTLENHVYWVEVTGLPESGNCTLRTAPIQMNDILYQHLYQNKEAIIFTSATLTVTGSFQYFMERTGIDLLPA